MHRINYFFFYFKYRQGIISNIIRKVWKAIFIKALPLIRYFKNLDTFNFLRLSLQLPKFIAFIAYSFFALKFFLLFAY